MPDTIELITKTVVRGGEELSLLCEKLAVEIHHFQEDLNSLRERCVSTDACALSDDLSGQKEQLIAMMGKLDQQLVKFYANDKN